MKRRTLLLVALCLLTSIAVARAEQPRRQCELQFIEAGTTFPVSLVIVSTTGSQTWVSDNAGRICFDAGELFDREVFLHVSSPGYEIKADGFGIRGHRFTPKDGEKFTIELARTSIAQRIGRMTGSGLFSESQKLGYQLDWKESGVVGCDSVQLTTYQGQLRWIWGDTSLHHYPLGIFDASSATTPPLTAADLTAPLKMNYLYERDKNDRPRGTAPVAGPGPTWITGVISVKDRAGRERLITSYTKIEPPLAVIEWGLVVWNDETKTFEKTLEIWSKSSGKPLPKLLPDGHVSRYTDEAGKSWLLFGNPLPKLRVPDAFESYLDPSTWQEVHSPPALTSVDGKSIELHSGSIAWHPHRKMWTTVFMQRFGKPSVFGEIWYAEADSPLGPWSHCVKILSHANYTFYNPRVHGEFASADSSTLFFEATYTAEFADKPFPTPRYNYNQLLYQVDLSHKDLSHLTVPSDESAAAVK